MKIRIPLYALVTTFAIVNLAAAQQPKKIPRIGYLSAVESAGENSRSEAILNGLRDLGYIEG